MGLLILYELWAGERLSLEKAQPRYLRPARPISVSAVLFGPGIDIWRSCRFIGSLMRSLCFLPGGLARFIPCSIGANHCRLRSIGWEKCGHGLTSRPRESASVLFLDEVGSGRALLAGTLHLRYCFDRFACRSPAWRLPASGGVRDLLAASIAVGHEVVPAVDRGEVFRVRNSCLRGKRIRLNRKNSAHLAGFGDPSRPRVWKRLRPVDLFGDSYPGHKRRRGAQDSVGFNPSQVRTGVG